MAADETYADQLKRQLAATRKRVAAFRKAAPKAKDKLLEEGRVGRSFLFAAPAKDAGLAFVEKYFTKEIAKPHAELAAITQAWATCAPDYAKAEAQLASFKRGILEVVAPSAAIKYRLDMDLRTGLEQRLRSAHRGETLKKVKVSLPGGASKAKTDADQAENESLRSVQLSQILKAAEKGEL